MSSLRSPLLRRLDYLPPWTAGLLGVTAGALAGAALLAGTPTAVGTVGFVVLLGLAGALAWSGEPIAVPLPVVDEKKKLSVELVTIPAGRFMMGSPEGEEGRYSDEGPVHEVSVSAFECMKYQVTRRLCAEVTGKDPGSPEGAADERPVNNVSWFDAVRFCNGLSEKDELEPCYQVDDEDNNVTWNAEADGYRLPTEAEWEYACRAGTQSRWSFGDDEDMLGEHAWYTANSGSQPHPVGEKEPNPWDLHDMHGNVYEWCWDWYDEYTSEAQQDPQGPPEGTSRMLRGGAFFDSPRGLRSAIRIRDEPEFSFRFIGFRCVRGPRRQP